MTPFVVTLFLCGDVMTGRGIDQILPHSVDPILFERYIQNAGDYVLLAESGQGPIPRPVETAYIWGDAISELDRRQPDVRIINLETSVTRSATPWPGKGINYRMHPGNVAVLETAEIDCCVLANNHVLDWKEEGLKETLKTIGETEIETAGAGANLEESRRPAVLESHLSESRVIVFSMASGDCGVPDAWAATEQRAGVNLFSPEGFADLVERVRKLKRPRDVVVVSIHWGSNWGYRIPDWQTDLAHRLIDEAGVDLVHGHSSHHVRPLEVYRGKLVLYGCGDFINDYEGISGYEEFRSDLRIMFFVSIDTSNRQLTQLRLVPMQTRRFRLHRASREDSQWLLSRINRVSNGFGVSLDLQDDGSFLLSPPCFSNGQPGRARPPKR
jgi:poly-gamma-glutamate synthesis protein (capsule biosynthesis protein)